MNELMRQANLVEPRRVVIQEVPTPVPGSGEVRIAVAACGICGSDVHAFLGEHPFITAPIVIGHEFSGVVDAVGPDVVGLSLGLRVTVEPGLTCGECEPCRSGRYNICENLAVLGCQSTGAMAEHVVVPAKNVVPLLEGMSFEQGAMVEPAAVAVHALRRASLSRVDRLLIIGAGPIGLLTLQVAAAWWNPTVVVTDIVDARLHLAAQLGATYTVNTSRESLSDFCRDIFGKSSAMDLVMECVGSQVTLAQAIESVKKGGRVVIVGVPATDPCIKMSWVQDRELELLGTLMYTRPDFEEAMRLIANGTVRTETLISKRFPLAETSRALEDLLRNRETTVKTLITVESQLSGSEGGRSDTG